MAAPSDMIKAADHWNQHTARFGQKDAGVFWWDAGPEIQRHQNRLVSGDPETDWTEYTIDTYFQDRLPLQRCLVLGCGTGALERGLARRGVFVHCDAYDIAEGSLQEARRLANEAGLIGKINYAVADVNALVLPPGVYDAVWISSAMHHFRALEHIIQQLSHSLKTDGLLILNEYVGPNRFQFPPRQKEVANLCLRLLPARYRTRTCEHIELELERNPLRQGWTWTVSRVIDKVRHGDMIGVLRRRARAYSARSQGRSILVTEVDFPTAEAVIAVDPSEAVRSQDILEVLNKSSR